MWCGRLYSLRSFTCLGTNLCRYLLYFKNDPPNECTQLSLGTKMKNWNITCNWNDSEIANYAFYIYYASMHFFGLSSAYDSNRLVTRNYKINADELIMPSNQRKSRRRVDGGTHERRYIGVIRSVSFCAAEHHTLPRLAIHIIKMFFVFVALNHFAFSNVHCAPMFGRQLPKKKIVFFFERR